MRNPLTALFGWLNQSVFETDGVALIQRRQADIRRINARAAEKTSNATLDIEDAVDTEIEVIRATAAASFMRIGQLVNTGAVSKSASDALTKASKQIDGALNALDAAI